jgi:palmitoyltransferase
MFGQSLVHMSAQSHDAYFTIFCHSVLSCSLLALDSRGRTPLHLAALEGKAASIGLLLAITKEVNVKDNEGLTPLHYAVMSGSEGILRQLLRQGADREATDNRGKKPFHLAEVKKNKRIAGMVKHQPWWSEFNPVSHPLKPVNHRFLLLGLYHFVMLAWYAMVILFIVPGLAFWIAIISLVLLVFAFCLFEAASFSDPGFRRDADRDLLKLYSKYTFQYVCAFCKAKKGPTDVHCVYCNRCVKGFDHHCPWINNCIGVNNQKLFVVFLAATEANFIYHFFIGLLDYFGLISYISPLYPDPFDKYDYLETYFELVVSVLCAVGSLAMLPCLYSQIRNLRRGNRSSIKTLEEQSDTHSMLVQGDLAEELLFTPRHSSDDSESLIRMTVEDVSTSTGCFGLCKVRRFKMVLDAEESGSNYTLITKLDSI